MGRLFSRLGRTPESEAPRRRWIRRVRVTVAAAAVAVALLFAALAIRAANRPSRQPAVAAAPRAKIDEKAAIDRLSQALQFKTVSAPSEFKAEAFQEFHAFLKASYPKAHGVLKREVICEYSLLYHWGGRNSQAPAILLMSHLDVVPVPNLEVAKWTHPPWGGVVDDDDDDYIWGRGALDVKCGVMALLEAVEHLIANNFQPECDVYLAFGHDEEIGGIDGNAQIALTLREREVRLRFVLDEGGVIVEGIMPGLEPPLALVAVAEKGYANVKLSVDMPGGHASMPPPQSAIGILAAAVARLEENPRPAMLAGAVGSMLDYVAPEMPPATRLVLANHDVLSHFVLRRLEQAPSTNALIRTTTAVTVIEGGKSSNVLPSEAEATVHFRLLPGDTAQAVLEHVRITVDDERVKCNLDSRGSDPSRVSDHESEDFRILQKTMRQIDPNVVVAPGLAVVATDSRHYEPLAGNIFRFLPLRLSSGDLKRIHGVDERIAVSNYLEIVQFLILLVQNAATVETGHASPGNGGPPG
jgi:carboxypeptidase PM20D1